MPAKRKQSNNQAPGTDLPESYRVGDLVAVKMKGYPTWPGEITKILNGQSYEVFWFGSQNWKPQKTSIKCIKPYESMTDTEKTVADRISKHKDIEVAIRQADEKLNQRKKSKKLEKLRKKTESVKEKTSVITTDNFPPVATTTTTTTTTDTPTSPTEPLVSPIDTTTATTTTAATTTAITTTTTTTEVSNDSLVLPADQPVVSSTTKTISTVQAIASTETSVALADTSVTSTDTLQEAPNNSSTCSINILSTIPQSISEKLYERVKSKEIEKQKLKEKKKQEKLENKKIKKRNEKRLEIVLKEFQRNTLEIKASIKKRPQPDFKRFKKAVDKVELLVNDFMDIMKPECLKLFNSDLLKRSYDITLGALIAIKGCKKSTTPIGNLCREKIGVLKKKNVSEIIQKYLKPYSTGDSKAESSIADGSNGGGGAMSEIKTNHN